ncbi:MAG TPA: BNR-4 repeat-containing protein, partial [Patescibacteria group bacterium]|nr:BNR-4 repeat-containing protein [Patescibacteria group bacterium]
EPRTIDDPYHTAPSIGIDKSGYVHVVYNMHNMPWQYAVSEQPGDISRFTFKGTRLSDAQIADLAADRFTAEVVRAMSDVGTAAIPGNQITYPAFFHDRHGELYVTYRFAIKPAAAPADRAFGCGIARYDVERQTWTAIGGGVADAPGVTAFCVKAGWTAYLPRLWFDKGNGMHVTWTWRRGQAGAEMTRPGYAFSADAGKTFQAADGTAYRLPITPETTKAFMGAGEDGFFAMTSLTTSPKGRIYAGVQPLGSAWSMTMREPGQALWSPPQIAPYGAQALMADDSGTVWAFASGPRILNRPADAAADAPWRLVYSSSGYNFPKVLMVPEEKAFLLHVLADDTSSARILMVHWQ